MKLRHLLSVGLLGMGIAMTPVFTSTVRADNPLKKEQRGPAQFLERFRATVDKLEITADQKPKIDAAFADAKTKMDAALKDAGEDRDARRAKVQPVIKELTEKIVAVLTPEQKEKLDKLRKEGGRRPPANNN